MMGDSIGNIGDPERQTQQQKKGHQKRQRQRCDLTVEMKRNEIEDRSRTGDLYVNAEPGRSRDGSG